MTWIATKVVIAFLKRLVEHSPNLLQKDDTPEKVTLEQLDHMISRVQEDEEEDLEEDDAKELECLAQARYIPEKRGDLYKIERKPFCHSQQAL